MHERAWSGSRRTALGPCLGAPSAANPRIRRALLGTAGYGFALPANAVIVGTNTASMHAIPNAMSIAFDMTRSISRDVKGINAAALTGDEAEVRKMLLNRIFV